MRSFVLCSCLVFVCGCGSPSTPAVTPAQPAPAPVQPAPPAASAPTETTAPQTAVAAKAMAADKPKSADQIHAALERGISKPKREVVKGHRRTVQKSSRVWTVKELKDQVGEPSSRKNAGSSSSAGKEEENWTWTVDDGTVHARFRSRGYLHTDDPGSLRLEIVSTSIARSNSKPKSEATIPEKEGATPASGASQPAPAASSKAEVRAPTRDLPKRHLNCDAFKDRVLKERGEIMTKQEFYAKFGKPASLKDVVQHSQPRSGSYSFEDAGRAMQQAISSASRPRVVLTYNLSDGVVEVSAIVVDGGWRIATAEQVQ